MIDALYRRGYVLCMYTGLRAAFNRVRSRLDRGSTAVSFLHRTTIRPPGLGTMHVFVHGGPRPRPARAARHYGMVSVRSGDSNLGRFLYRYLCMTSHFGCGQVEIAFYESAGRVTIYAVRDVARANAARLGWHEVSARLGSSESDLRVVRALVARLERSGMTVRIAPAPECVELALNRRLVHPRTLERTREALERMYWRLPHALDSSPLELYDEKA